MSVDGRKVVFLEIQRRARTKTGTDGESEPSEEAYKGLVCTPDSMEALTIWVRGMMDEIRLKKGIVKHLEGRHIATSFSYAHRMSRKDGAPCEGAAYNALDKVWIRRTHETTTAEEDGTSVSSV